MLPLFGHHILSQAAGECLLEVLITFFPLRRCKRKQIEKILELVVPSEALDLTTLSERRMHSAPALYVVAAK